MVLSPASGDQEFLEHSSMDPLTEEPDTAAHHIHPSTGDKREDEGYVQSRSDISDLQDTTGTPPEPTVRPSSTCPTPWAIANLIALSKGSGCHSVPQPQDLQRDFYELLDSMREKGPKFLAFGMCHDVYAHLQKDTKRLSIDKIDTYVKDFLVKVKTKSGRSFTQITPKTKPNAGTQMVEALCWDAKPGQLDPRTSVVEDFFCVMKRLGLDPDLRESDLLEVPEMLLALALGLALAQICAVVPPDTPILSVYDDIIDRYCALTDLLPLPRRPPPPSRHPPPAPQYPQLTPTTLLFMTAGMLLLSHALSIITICFAISCLPPSKSSWS